MSLFTNRVVLFSLVAGWFLTTIASLPATGAALSVATSAAIVLSGKATYYGGNTNGGMCSFTGYTIPSGTYGTAVSSSNWAGAQICGACIQVTGSAGTIKAMVTDQCPNCGTNHLDLYQDAFPHVGPVSAGIIPVTWSIVPCGITTPLKIRNKVGTSKYWFSMQVVNSNTEVKALDVSTDGGRTWKATARQPYNYFENNSGFGTDTVTVRITSSNGKTITLENMSVASESSKMASSNF
ncbi:barwin-like endoglucanase [Venturia nashicola]|nr:barwin-like endoglucanase [Venturia nashicola]